METIRTVIPSQCSFYIRNLFLFFPPSLSASIKLFDVLTLMRLFDVKSGMKLVFTRLTNQTRWRWAHLSSDNRASDGSHVDRALREIGRKTVKTAMRGTYYTRQTNPFNPGAIAAISSASSFPEMALPHLSLLMEACQRDCLPIPGSSSSVDLAAEFAARLWADDWNLISNPAKREKKESSLYTQ